MTKIDQYDTIKLLAIATATILTIPIIAQTPVQIATALQNSTDTEIDQKHSKLLLASPKTLSDTDLVKVKEIALKDAKVQKLVNKKPYTFVAYDFLTYDTNADPVVFYVEVHFNVDDKKQVSAVVDQKGGKVIDVMETDVVQLSPPGAGNRAFAIDWYSSLTRISALRMQTDPPTYTSNLSAALVAFLLNGKMKNSVDICDGNHSNDTTHYWMQIGFVYLTDGGHLSWTDSMAGSGVCAPIHFVTQYKPECTYHFTIYADTGGWTGIWSATGPTGCTAGGNTPTRTGLVNEMQVNTWDTSVFLESANSGNVPLTWDNQFQNAQGIKEYPKAYASKRTYGASSFSSWGADKQQILDNCPSTPPDSFATDPLNVITNNLQSTTTQAAWRVDVFADNYAATCP